MLESGREFYGYGFGADREATGEIVFNTSMVGYQEILSDPSYTDQMVVMTYPLIGNYGITDEDYETKYPTIGGMIVREYNDLPSNFPLYPRPLAKYARSTAYPASGGIDTRMLTRIIRDDGYPAGDRRRCVDAAGGGPAPPEGGARAPRHGRARELPQALVLPALANHRFDVVAVDCGIKHNIIRKLNEKGCNVTVVPYDITAEEVMAFRPDGLFLSNGPGDPTDVQPVIEMVRTLRGRLPIFGICLGHQVISLAYGARTFKMKFGHRGGNHPVKNLETGKVEITSQNHSFAVDTESLKGTGLTLTHLNLLDDTAEGVECRADRIFSVQYHPESAPGPQDSTYLFDKFIKMMEESQNA